MYSLDPRLTVRSVPDAGPITGPTDFGGSRYSKFDDCQYLYWLMFEKGGGGYETEEDKYATSFGTLVHTGLDHLYKNIVFNLAYTLDHLEEVCVQAIHEAVKTIPELSIIDDEKPKMKDEVIA